jgi:hypothetical protein
MGVYADHFHALYDVLQKQHLLKAGRNSLGNEPVEARARELVQQFSGLLPTGFEDAYSAPLQKRLPALFAQLTAGNIDANFLETLCGPVYQLGDSALKKDLHRFLAVVADLYDSFLNHTKRRAVNVPLVERLPPVAVWQSSPAQGPFTLPVDEASKLIGATIGAVSLPHGFAGHPFLYAALTHETGGHDVIHADPGLMAQLQRGVYELFPDQRWLALLWDYWMDETAADVYGILNMGPAFAPSFAALIAVFLSGGGKGPAKLRTETGADETGALDVHPTDVLRIGVARGVVQALAGLSASARNQYASAFDDLIALAGDGSSGVQIQGNARGFDGRSLEFMNAYPLDEMLLAASRVGNYVATVKLDALDGHSIQDIETWGDSDESTAAAIGSKLLQGSSVVGAGDDAQLIAGLVQALMQRPDEATYKAATDLVNAALDDSFARDPYWGTAVKDRWVTKPSAARVLTPPPDRFAALVIDHNALEDKPELAMAGAMAAVARHRSNPVPWPDGKAPKVIESAPRDGAALTECDVVLFTYTADEGNALATLLTPGHLASPSSSTTDKPWHSYTHKFADYEADLVPRSSPALESRNLGTFMYVTIGKKTVLCFKSSLHLARDGQSMPVKKLVKQICSEAKPALFVTTGTAGGIGPRVRLGDAVASTRAKLDLVQKFKNNPANGKTFESTFQWHDPTVVDEVNKRLLEANASFLPTGVRGPKLFTDTTALNEPNVIVTTDGFLYDDAENTYHLQGQGCMVEMDDAVVALGISELTDHKPLWLAIRNASDPQMPAGASKESASQTYTKYGFYTSFTSVLGCWAAVLGGAY